MTKSDFVRRPGHGGKPGSHSRGTPASLPCEKKETDAGEFSPTTNWPNQYKPEPEHREHCTHCQEETRWYYTRTQHSSILVCSICGKGRGEN